MSDPLTREATRISAGFIAAGASPVTADILQPAEILLDLYGEDIRARAYVTTDPLRGEMMLRPDFTVPVVQMHMANRIDPARYTYAGPVFRKQDHDATRAIEYPQVGFEVFDGADPAAADADVFVAVSEALQGLPLRAATGDIGLLMAAVRGLQTSDARKSALLRHIWRPARFRALLDRFGGRTPAPASRTALLAAADPMANTTPQIGLRSKAEVVRRIENLRADAAEPPISGQDIDAIEALLSVSGSMSEAITALRDIAKTLPAITSALDVMAARATALSARGVDVDALSFEGSYGRTTLEYYDGFVFGFYAETHDLPPIATGGRYDALTARLGQGIAQPAVGAVVRPDLCLSLGEAQNA